MAVVLSNSYGTLSREELLQTQKDMAFVSNYMKKMTKEQKAKFRENPKAERIRIFKLALAARKSKSTQA